MIRRYLNMRQHKILVLGASGMLGNAVLRYFATHTDHEVVGSIRAEGARGLLPFNVQDNVVTAGSVDDPDMLARLFDRTQPTVVINCVGLVKQLDEANDPLSAIPINSILPHRLGRLCSLVGARLVHLSTDCVFSGAKGMYSESDVPDANDVYGRTKLLGEVSYAHTITLRTSIIGHELKGSSSLIGWFLAQQGSVKGFSRAVFSGLPTVEIARIINEHVLPDAGLHGLYHLSADPIDKYQLLQLVANVYGKETDIVEDHSLLIDRSLDSSRFRDATGFKPVSWPVLVRRMYEFK
jgi:dTDP-4-dehydrorhamnose reductase